MIDRLLTMALLAIAFALPVSAQQTIPQTIPPQGTLYPQPPIYQPIGPPQGFVNAQLLSDQNPSVILTQLISAFQNCGPQSTYTLLGYVIFQTVAIQTGNSGCYPQIQQLGPLQSLERLGASQLPAGPVTTFRARHSFGSTYWQIGISRFTQKVEWLAFQPTPFVAPPRGDDSGGAGDGRGASGSGGGGGGSGGVDRTKGCVAFPDMCK